MLSRDELYSDCYPCRSSVQHCSSEAASLGRGPGHGLDNSGPWTDIDIGSRAWQTRPDPQKEPSRRDGRHRREPAQESGRGLGRGSNGSSGRTSWSAAWRAGSFQSHATSHASGPLAPDASRPVASDASGPLPSRRRSAWGANEPGQTLLLCVKGPVQQMKRQKTS